MDIGRRFVGTVYRQMHSKERLFVLKQHLTTQPRIVEISKNNLSARKFSTCKAAVCTELGKPLKIEEIELKDQLDSNEVLISVQSCGINFADILQCKGLYQDKKEPPFVPGVEMAGQILDVGSKVSNVSKGDRVVGMGQQGGGFATRCILNKEDIWKLPESVAYKTASSFLVTYATSLLALSRKAKLQAGETVLVTAAAGGTGLAAVDIAANVFGAQVIAACGGEDKCALVKRIGAQYTIDYNKENLRARIKEITQGKGVNVVFDPVGGDLFLDCVKSLAYEGRILTIGYAAGKIPSVPANLLLLKSASAIGAWFGQYRNQIRSVFDATIDDVIKMCADGKVHPHIGKEFPLQQANEAFDFVSSRKSTGKVVITMEENT